MKDKVIKIFTICTSKYNEYLPEFINTLDNFMPDYWKDLYVISDQQPDFDKLTYHSIKNIIYQHIFHQYYQFIQMSKLDFITQCKDIIDDDIFFYFDVDTKFAEKTKEYWDDFYNKIETTDLIFSRHASYIYHAGNNELIQGESFANMKGASKFHYTKDSVYLCSSMFGGNIKSLNKLKLIYDKLRKIDYDIMYMGSWGDEHYINRLINDTSIKLGISIVVAQFVYVETPATINKESEVFDKYKHIWCIQKYDISHKEDIKKLNV